MALAKWILIVVLLNHTGNTSNAHRIDDAPTYFLESCASAIVVKLHKDRPNDIIRIRLFDSFPEKPLEQCECRIYVYIEEFYRAWMTHSLSPRLRNYKVLVTLEDLNWPVQCDKISCVVEDNQRNGTTMCTELAENVYNYRFDLNYRRSLPLKDDYYLEMSVGVAYMPYGSDTNGCPSNEYFQCVEDSLCIPSRFWCDEISHCSDESDEKDCEDTKRPPTIVVASSEDPYSADLNTEPFNSAEEDYSSEEDAEATKIGSESVTPVPASTVVTTQRPTTPKPELTTTTKRTSETPTTVKPSKTTTKATVAKKQGSAVKVTKETGKVTPTSPPPSKASITTVTTPTTTAKTTTSTITTTTTKPVATTTPPTPILTTQTALTQASREEPPSITESTTTSTTSTTTATTSAKVATASTPTTSSTPKPETSTRALVHFSFTERPSIAIIGRNSDRGLSSSERSPSQTGQGVTRTSSDNLASATMEPRPATNERRKDFYDLEVVTFDDSNSIVSTVPNVVMKHNSKNSSAKPPYPWSDRYDSRSRNSAAVSSNSVPNQWVLVVLCLILVFIYFFL